MSLEVVIHDGATGMEPHLPPGPRLGLAHTVRFLNDANASLEYLQRRYGDLFTLPSLAAFGRMTFVGEPNVIKQIFAAGPTRFHTGEPNAIMLEPIVGENSILSLDEERHKRSRKIMMPPLYATRVRTYEPVMTEIVEAAIDSMPLHEEFPLVQSLRTIALDVLMQLMLGVRGKERLALFREVVEPVASPPNILTWLPALRRDLGPWSPWTRFVKVRDRLYALLDEEIERRRHEPDLEERNDILSLLVQARHEDGEPLTGRELRDEMMGVMGAGHHTTTAASAWLFDQVLRDPKIEQRLRDEIEAGEETYLEATIDETLRWRAPIFGVPRKTMQDIEIGPWRIPAGNHLTMAFHLVHRRADLYPEPERFRPERFLEQKADPLIWIPFGGGERRCIGANFARLEMKVIARTMLRRLRMTLADTRREPPRFSYVIIYPYRGVKVVVNERRPSPAPALAAAG